MGGQEPRRPGPIETALTLASMLAVSWFMLPPQERYWIRLQSLHLAHKLTARLALQTGWRGMGDELAGRDYQRYGVAYRVSQARDYIGHQLEAMRP